MIHILYGNSEHVARAFKGKKGLFGIKKIRFVTALDLIKGLKQVK